MRERWLYGSIVTLMVFSATAAAQANDVAVYIPSNEIQSTTGGTAIRIVDVGNAYVGISRLVRHKAEAGKAGNPLTHSKVSEVYIITAGSATLATGGMITEQKPYPVDKDVILAGT